MQVRAWYGLTGAITVENELWHLVKIGRISLPHPPLVNLILRYGLARPDRLRLSYLHEFGHLQTLPVALVHLLLLTAGHRRRRFSGGWGTWLAALVIAHQALWELSSEAYVMLHMGTAYSAIYRRTSGSRWLLAAFWLTMGGLAVGLSNWLLSASEERRI